LKCPVTKCLNVQSLNVWFSKYLVFKCRLQNVRFLKCSIFYIKEQKYYEEPKQTHDENILEGLGEHYLVKVLTCKEHKNLQRNTEQKHHENILVGLGRQRNTEQKDYENILVGLGGHYLVKLITSMSMTKFSQIFIHSYFKKFFLKIFNHFC
jgi:hypothetical protein